MQKYYLYSNKNSDFIKYNYSHRSKKYIVTQVPDYFIPIFKEIKIPIELVLKVEINTD